MPVIHSSITPKGDRVVILSSAKSKVKPTESKPPQQKDRLPDVEIMNELALWADDGGYIPPDSTD